METLVKESSYADDFKLNNGIPNEKDIIETSQIKENVQKGPLERGNENGVIALEMPELKTLNTGCECFGRHIENETETRTNGPEAQKNTGESSCPTEMAENEKSSSEDVCELRVGHSQSDDSIVKMRKSSGRNSPAAFPTDTRYISAAFEFLKSDDLNLANNENKENLCENQNKPEKTQEQSDEKTVKRGSVTSNNICDRNSSASAISNISALSDFGGSVKSDESTESQVQENSRNACNANVEVSTETPDQGTRGMSPTFHDSPFRTPNISVNSEFSFSEGISNGTSRTSAQAPIDEESLNKTASECKGKDPLVRKRSKKSSVQSQESSEQDSEDSSDEDSGVYAESHRNSHWIKVEDDGTLTLPSMHYTIAEEVDQSDVASETSGASSAAKDATLDEVFEDQPSEFPRSHKRSDSSATTASESEFRNKFRYLRKCSVQRQSSQQQFYRMSTKYYEDESTVTVEKDAGNEDFGLHILDSHPAVISNVIPGSAAESAGVLPGQILVSVNGVNVLEASHAEIIKLIQQNPDSLTVSLGQSDVFHSRDLLSPVLSGFLTKLASSGLIKLWRKRWFVLRQDNCLYYYKSENDKDPLGAIPLSNYSVSKAPESSKDYAFKLEKYGAKSYFFSAESDASRKQWANAMTVAAHSTLKTESWLDVTSHNVGIPALSIRNPECTGYIQKSGDGKKAWKKRYCVLKDACIYYYKGIGSYSAQGVAHLHGYQLDSDVTCSKRHAFKLLPPEPNMRAFLFATENDTDRERWMNSMTKSIGRWQRISMTS